MNVSGLTTTPGSIMDENCETGKGWMGFFRYLQRHRPPLVVIENVLKLYAKRAAENEVSSLLDLDLHYSAWFACQHAVLRYSFSRTVKQTKVPPDPESIEPAGIRGVPDQLQCRGLRAAAKQASGMGAGSATRAAAPASGHGRHHECPPVPTKVFVCLLVGGQGAEDDRGDDPVPLAEPFCDREGAKMARGFRFLVQEARPCPNHSFNEKGSCHALPSMILEVIISP